MKCRERGVLVAANNVSGMNDSSYRSGQDSASMPIIPRPIKSRSIVHNTFRQTRLRGHAKVGSDAESA